MLVGAGEARAEGQEGGGWWQRAQNTTKFSPATVCAACLDLIVRLKPAHSGCEHASSTITTPRHFVCLA